MLRESQYPDELRRVTAELSPERPVKITWTSRQVQRWPTQSLISIATSEPVREVVAAVYDAEASSGDLPIVLVPAHPTHEVDLTALTQPARAKAYGVLEVGYPIVLAIDDLVLRPAGPATVRLRRGPPLPG